MGETICSRFKLSKLFVNMLNDVFKYTSKKDYDYVIVVSGDEGSGKSTLALEIAMLLNKFKNNRACIDTDYIYFTNSELTRFFQNVSEELNVHIFDEAHNIVASANATTKTNKNLTAFLKTARALKQFYIFVTPTFFSLDADVLRRADMLVHVQKRGRALVFTGDAKDNLIIASKFAQKKLSKLVKVEYIINRYNIRATMLIKFSNISSEAYKQYYEIKRARLLEFINNVLANTASSDSTGKFVSVKKLKEKLNDETLSELILEAKKANALKVSKRAISIDENFVNEYLNSKHSL